MSQTKTTKTGAKSSVMADLLEKSEKNFFPKIGELIKAVVINAGRNEVLLDINGTTTGIVRGSELEDESGEYSVLKVGDEVEATVLDVENERGLLELSFRYAGHQRAWDNLQKLLEDKELVSAKIIDANKGGLMSKVGGVMGFLPVSQLTPEHYPRVDGGDKTRILEILKSYIGTDFDVKIIDVNEREEKLIVSEKAAWEEKQKDLLSKYKVGTAVKGTVTGVVDFGAFVSFDSNMEGLVHISELAWQRIDNPRDVVKVGDVVEAQIIGVDRSKISLSIKALNKDPWVAVGEKYKIGDTVKGKVLKLSNFGAFVELDENIHGLAHLSELSAHNVKDPADILVIGDTKEFKIVSLEPEKHRLGLSLKSMKAPAKKKVDDKEKEVEAKTKKADKPAKKEEKKSEKKPAKKKVEKEDKKVDAKKDKTDKKKAKIKKADKPAKKE
ncbi:MAG: S1 RNA-binding domain-containing protein [Proteobacteria bacterium]|nr:S1 RNA-binding domain-containing protein [Pseudomonadota bacterium]